MRHISRVTLALECGVETVFLEPRAVCAVAAIRPCLDQPADPGCGVGMQRVAEMTVQRRHGADRVPNQIKVLHVKDRLREALFLRRGNHQFGRRQPAVAVLTPDLGLVDAAGEWPPQGFGQSRNRQKDGERVPMHEDQAGVRIDRPYRVECEDMVGAFEHPAPASRRLMLEVLQKALVKAIRLEMSGFVEPAPVARNTVSRVEAQAGKNMRGDLGTFLGRTRVDRVHTAEIRRQQPEEPQLAGDPQRPAVAPGFGISRRIGVDQLPDARHQIGRVLGQQAVQKGRAGAGSPEIKIGRSTGRARISGALCSSSNSRSRFDRNRTTSQRVATRPTRLNFPSS